MAFSGVALAYSAAGGLIAFSGIKGATIADTVKAVLSGNLSVKDTENVNFGGSGTNPSGPSGSAILSDAEQYNGHKYVYGGPSNPTDGWDCSSFASYVLGHDLNMTLPGGQSWATATNNGKSHGPVADQFANMPGFSKVGTDLSQIQPGDLLVWADHVGFGVSPSQMFSAYDTASGTEQSAIQGSGSFIGIYRVSSGGSSATSGSADQNYLTIGKYLMVHGYSAAGAAGVVGCIAGESTGNPEAVENSSDPGAGGEGLIQWTPGSKYHVPITGNASKDLEAQLPMIISYNNAQGAGLIAMLNAQTDPVQAADFYSTHFERPAVTDSDVNASVAQSVYAQLKGGS